MKKIAYLFPLIALLLSCTIVSEKPIEPEETVIEYALLKLYNNVETPGTYSYIHIDLDGEFLVELWYDEYKEVYVTIGEHILSGYWYIAGGAALPNIIPLETETIYIGKYGYYWQFH